MGWPHTDAAANRRRLTEGQKMTEEPSPGFPSRGRDVNRERPPRQGQWLVLFGVGLHEIGQQVPVATLDDGPENAEGREVHIHALQATQGPVDGWAEAELSRTSLSV